MSPKCFSYESNQAVVLSKRDIPLLTTVNVIILSTNILRVSCRYIWVLSEMEFHAEKILVTIPRTHNYADHIDAVLRI